MVFDQSRILSVLPLKDAWMTLSISSACDAASVNS